jgi:hypothetical protein
MCGPSGAEQNISNEQDSLSSLLSADFSQRWASQTSTLANLNQMLTPISEAGPDQQGFGPQEQAAINTQIGEGVGQNYAKATQALNNTLDARGGNEYLPTGSSAALQGTLASSAANQLSQEQLGATEANYTQGRQNWQTATAGLNALAGEYNPGQFSGQAQSGFNSSFSMANQIQQQTNQEQADIAGGVVSLGMDAATFGAGALAGNQGFDLQGGLAALTKV